MTDAFDERRKGLEEEYFHRQNKEAIEKLRAKMKISEEAKAAGTSTMKCPRSDGKLEESKFEGVSIDTCDKCGGVWLDSGELEQLTKHESGGWLSKLRHSDEAKPAGTSTMKCPRCDGKLGEIKIEGVSIDTCDKCGGVWLDSGELEQLTKHESGGWFSRLRHSWNPK